MANQQGRDVFDGVQQFHTQVSEYYRSLRSQVKAQRVQLLLDYMSQHQQRLAANLADYKSSAPKRVLDTWFKFGSKLTLRDVVVSQSDDENMSVDDVMDLSLRIDDCLITVYEDLAENAKCDEVRTVFRNLYDMESKERRLLARDMPKVLDF